jgi:hypothetical protein
VLYTVCTYLRCTFVSLSHPPSVHPPPLLPSLFLQGVACTYIPPTLHARPSPLSSFDGNSSVSSFLVEFASTVVSLLCYGFLSFGFSSVIYWAATNRHRSGRGGIFRAVVAPHTYQHRQSLSRDTSLRLVSPSPRPCHVGAVSCCIAYSCHRATPAPPHPCCPHRHPLSLIRSHACTPHTPHLTPHAPLVVRSLLLFSSICLLFHVFCHASRHITSRYIRVSHRFSHILVSSTVKSLFVAPPPPLPSTEYTMNPKPLHCVYYEP